MRILALSTWFPYPPSHGGKMREYYLIKALAEQHEVALLSFRDAEIAPEHLDHMRGICSRVDVIKDDPFAKNRWKLLLGFFSPSPRSIVSGFSQNMKRAVHSLAVDWNPDVFCGFQVYTAQYLRDFSGKIKIADIDNVMSRYLFDIYGQAEGPVSRMRRWIAWKKNLSFERAVFNQFDRCLVSSDREKEEAESTLGLPANKIFVIPNGVDTTLNTPDTCKPEKNTLVFNGSMTFSANLDAMIYFVDQIYPHIQAQIPDVHLKITGKADGVNLDWASKVKNVTFTGFLKDIRPAITASYACVVPLRLGVGTRLKILEAMALGTPVITTTKGAEGLEVENGRHLLIADDPAEFSRQTLCLLSDPDLRERLSTEAGRLVHERYGWDKIGQGFQQILNDI
jgi:polysaccharide biosynthesis protein PslH